LFVFAPLHSFRYRAAAARSIDRPIDRVIIVLAINSACCVVLLLSNRSLSFFYIFAYSIPIPIPVSVQVVKEGRQVGS
jgi:hypothetical protein